MSRNPADDSLGSVRRPERPRWRADFFAFRTPLLPIDTLERFSAGLRAVDATGPDLDAALDADRAMLEGRLVDWLEVPEVREALFLSSPNIDGAIDAWLGDPTS